MHFAVDMLACRKAIKCGKSVIVPHGTWCVHLRTPINGESVASENRCHLMEHPIVRWPFWTAAHRSPTALCPNMKQPLRWID